MHFSVGCKAKEDIRYLYEGAEGFMPLPTYIVAPGMKSTGLTRWPGTVNTLDYGSLKFSLTYQWMYALILYVVMFNTTQVHQK